MRAEKSLRAQIIVKSCRPFTIRTWAFTHSEMSSLFMVFSTGVAGSHLGFKRLTLAAALRVNDKRRNTAQTFSNQGA